MSEEARQLLPYRVGFFVAGLCTCGLAWVGWALVECLYHDKKRGR